MSNEEQDIIQEFVYESLDNLNQAEEDFLSLEQAGGHLDFDLINRTFRAVHSIKGGAGFMGLAKIAELAHIMETLMDQMRKGVIPAVPRVTSVLLMGVDHLRAMLDDVHHSNSYEIKEIHQSLSDIITKGITKADDAPKKPQAPPAPAAEPQEKDPVKRMQGQGRKLLGNLFQLVLDLKKLKQFTSLDGVNEATAGLKQLQHEARLTGFTHISHMSRLLKKFMYMLQFQVLPIRPEVMEPLEDCLETFSKMIDNPQGNIPFKKEYYRLVNLILQGVAWGFVIDPADGEDESLDLAKIRLSDEEIFELGMTLRRAPVVPGETDADAEARENLFPPQPMPAAQVEPAALPQEEDAPAPELHPLETERVIHPTKQVAESQQERQHRESQEHIRVKLSLLSKMMTLASELVLVRNQQLQLTMDADRALKSNSQKLDSITTDLQEAVMQTRMQPVGNLFSRYNRIVRDLSAKLGKKMNLDVTGSNVEIDKNLLEALADPLTHMIRNSCDHGLEPPAERLAAGKHEEGTINLSAWHEGGMVHIEVKDDGRGIDLDKIKKKVLERGMKTAEQLESMTEKDLLYLLCLPGFSTASTVSDVSGRGVGMDVVRSNIENIGGNIQLSTVKGKGTAMRLNLPLTLAIIPGLCIKSQGRHFVLPQTNLTELVTLFDEEVETKLELLHGMEVYRNRDEILPLVRLCDVLSHPQPFTRQVQANISAKYQAHRAQAQAEFAALQTAGKTRAKKLKQELSFAVVSAGQMRFGLIFDEIVGTEEIVAKSMHPYLKKLGCYSGCTLLGDGSIALILDVLGLAKHAAVNWQAKDSELDKKKAKAVSDSAQDILLFQFGPDEQFAMPMSMIQRIEHIEMKKIEKVGGEEFITIDGVSTQIVRPDRFMKVSPFAPGATAYLLLPKRISKAVGLLLSGISDNLQVEVKLDQTQFQDPGLMGSMLIRDRLTLFIDIYKMIEIIDPDWKSHQTKKEVAVTTKVLLVEDIPFFQGLVNGYLSGAGYRVTVVGDGKQAVDAMRKDSFDLIVSDIEMPVMNGYEFIRFVRESLNNREIPALALTSLDKEEDRQTALRAGFDRYEVKIDRDRLLNAISELTAHRTALVEA